MSVGGKKSAVPPSRPPPPKSGGISFSFKALEEENDEDEDLVTYTGQFDKQVSEEKEKHARFLLEKEKALIVSKSPEIPHRPDVVGQKTSAMKTQKSLDRLLDIKDKIQDTLVKKKEEFLSESFGSGSSNSPKEMENSTVTEPSLTSTDSELFMSLEEPGNENFEFNDQFYEPEESDVVKKPEELNEENPGTLEESLADVNDEEQLEISDEYFNPNGEDFLELPGVQPMLRQRKRLQKFRKIKPIVPPSPVSLSKLSDKTTPEKIDVSSDKNNVKSDNKTEAEQKSNGNEHKGPTISGVNIPVKKLAVICIVLFFYLIIPLPSYLSGLLAGLMLSSGGWMLYLWVTQEQQPRPPIPDDPPLEELPPLLAPEMRDPKGEDGCYKVIVYILRSVSTCERNKIIPTDFH